MGVTPYVSKGKKIILEGFIDADLGFEDSGKSTMRYVFTIWEKQSVVSQDYIRVSFFQPLKQSIWL